MRWACIGWRNGISGMYKMVLIPVNTFRLQTAHVSQQPNTKVMAHFYPRKQVIKSLQMCSYYECIEGEKLTEMYLLYRIIIFLCLKGCMKSYFPHIIFSIFFYNMSKNLFSSLDIHYQPVKER